MRYMVFVKMSEEIKEAPAAVQEVMGKEMAQAFADGWMLDAGGLYETAKSTEFRVSDGTLTTIDGPYSEAKEVVGGYAVIEVRSHEDALAAARRVAEIHQQFWPGWEGSVQVRRISGPDEGPPQRS